MSIFLLLVLGVVAVFFGPRWYRKWKWETHDKHRITENKVVEKWTSLLEKGKGKGDAFMEKIARQIRDAKIPNISVSKKMIALGRDPRPFIVVEHDIFKGYYIYVGALDYGEQRLNIVWYLVLDTPEMANIRRAGRSGGGGLLEAPGHLADAVLGSFNSDGYGRALRLSILDKLELSNYVSLVHDIVVAETKMFAEENNIDFSKISTATKGFLNLS